jgi:hypothetical protein
MQLEATVSRDDLCAVLDQFVPLKIRLGESGGLALEGPISVALTPKSGILVSCSGTLEWPILGMTVPATMRSLVLRIAPGVAVRNGADALVFELQIERADVALLPAALESRLIPLVNEELAKKHVELSWNFGKTLSHTFALPAALESAKSLGLRVIGADVTVTAGAVTFCVSFGTEVSSRKDSPTSLAGGDELIASQSVNST